MKRETPVRLSEAIEFPGFMSELFGYRDLFRSDGNLWNVVGGGGGAGSYRARFYMLSTLWFSRLQRFGARFCYDSNGYGTAAINKLTILAMGKGFEYTSKDRGKQKAIEDWVEENDYHERSIENFRSWLIDGEVFTRLIGTGEETQLRWIDPDLIYSEGSDPKQDYFAGLLFADNDNEQPRAYKLWDKPWGDSASEYVDVPGTEIQHRKNAHFGRKRGFSWMLPVLFDIYMADSLTGNLAGAAEVLSKYALIRQHNAPEGAVDLMRAKIHAENTQWEPAEGVNGGPPTTRTESTEHVPRAAIIDASEGTEYRVLDGVNYAEFEVVLNIMLRKISSHFMLQMGLYANNKEDQGAYAAELTTGSWNVRDIQSMQDMWIRQDRKLLRQVGFDTKDVEIIAPDAAVPDKKAAVDEEAMLFDRKCLSPQTLCQNHDLDWEQEARQWMEAKSKMSELYNEPADEQDAEDENPGREGDK